ncbi:uncharacterized protein Dwil_GK20392 [Drosophila willistoni]|uniref:GK20392 n=1 Tax=Drosophila willistoni TaxID=7260 RepID=B4N536_DROWI|nr:classical arabinogalactan protein 4 [Drosophila willistoni]EDW79475.1 uncharacterized protein Dwil_GK20392 [Drosophila willistoni]
MELNIVVVALLISVLALAHSTVGQQQRQRPFYPAAGAAKPLRQLPLVAQPSRSYGPPAAVPAPAPAPVPAQPKPARLVANSEAQEDIDDAVEQVPVTNKATQPAPAAPPSAIVQPTIAYYPAQLGGFIQPTAFARITAAPVPLQTSPYIARYPYYAAYFG